MRSDQLGRLPGRKDPQARERGSSFSMAKPTYEEVQGQNQQDEPDNPEYDVSARGLRPASCCGAPTGRRLRLPPDAIRSHAPRFVYGECGGHEPVNRDARPSGTITNQVIGCIAR